MRARHHSKIRLRVLLAFGVIAASGNLSSAQSAWTQPPGATFVQVSLQRVGPYDELFTDSGPDFVPGREITEMTLEVYGEYGVAEGVTLIGIVPVKFLDAGSVDANATIQPTTIESGSETTLGNVFIGVRKQLSNGDIAVAGALGVELPTGSLDRATGLSSGLDAFTFLPMLSAGRGFGKAYVQGYVGAGLRTDDYSNDWRVGVESGYRFDRLPIAGNIDVVNSLEDGDVTPVATNLETGLYVDEQEYVAYGFKGHYEVSERFGIHGAARFASSGNSVAMSPFLSLGVTIRW